MKKEKCKKCGKCCRYMAFWLSKKPSKDIIRWVNLHKGAKVIKEGKYWTYRFYLKCSKLKNNRCSIYKQRPDLCKEYKCWEAGFPKP